MIAAFAAGMQSLTWVLFLLALFLYMFAVLARILFGSSGELAERLAPQGYDVEGLFGTIPRSMATLLGLMTFDDAMDLERRIGEVFPIHVILTRINAILTQIKLN